MNTNGLTATQVAELRAMYVQKMTLYGTPPDPRELARDDYARGAVYYGQLFIDLLDAACAAPASDAVCQCGHSYQDHTSYALDPCLIFACPCTSFTPKVAEPNRLDRCVCGHTYECHNSESPKRPCEFGRLEYPCYCTEFTAPTDGETPSPETDAEYIERVSNFANPKAVK